MDDFQVGDVVVLKSGSPDMTIMEIDNDTQIVTTTWFDGSTQLTTQFAKATLVDPAKAIERLMST